MKVYKKVFDFGKIDYNHTGRKAYPVTVEVELRDRNGEAEFSACGYIWNTKKTDCICGGQCLDEINKFLANNKLFAHIYYLWTHYHLNTMHPGTIEQTDALKAKPNINSYTEACDYLKSIGLYEVDYNGKPYRYGSGWITYPIPDNDLQLIRIIMNIESLSITPP